MIVKFSVALPLESVAVTVTLKVPGTCKGVNEALTLVGGPVPKIVVDNVWRIPACNDRVEGYRKRIHPGGGGRGKFHLERH